MTKRLPFSDSEDANELTASDPMALLLAMLLDQQIPIERAFLGPLTINERLGHRATAETLAAIDIEELTEVFATKPAVHRFPAAMAKKAKALGEAIVADYGGRPERLWAEAADGKELYDRIKELPGFGDMKARTLTGILGAHLDLAPDGWEDVLPDHMTLANVFSDEDLERYREVKRELKAKGKR